MTTIFKPTSAPKDVYALDVKRGWRRWDDAARRYVAAREGERDAREYYVIRARVEGVPDDCVYDPDARVFPRAPQPGETWRVWKDGNKTRVELVEQAQASAGGSSLASHARVIAGSADVADYLREIVALATMALNALEEGGER